MQFKVTTEDANRLGLLEICQRFADQQWLPAHMLSHEAAESVLDAFKRTVAGELELLQVEAGRARSPQATPQADDPQHAEGAVACRRPARHPA